MFERHASPRQIAANRLNAQNSTGPRSLEGKAVSSMNALKSGIDAESQVIPGENASDLQALAGEYHARFHPSTPEQRLLVDNLVHYEWLLRRFRTIEAQLVSSYMEIRPQTQYRYPLSYIYEESYRQFSRLQWRINSVDHLYHHTLAVLTRLQAPPTTDEPAESQLPAAPVTPAPRPTSHEIGFVPPTGPQPLAPTPREVALCHNRTVTIVPLPNPRSAIHAITPEFSGQSGYRPGGLAGRVQRIGR